MERIRVEWKGNTYGKAEGRGCVRNIRDVHTGRVTEKAGPMKKLLLSNKAIVLTVDMGEGVSSTVYSPNLADRANLVLKAGE